MNGVGIRYSWECVEHYVGGLGIVLLFNAALMRGEAGIRLECSQSPVFALFALHSNTMFLVVSKMIIKMLWRIFMKAVYVEKTTRELRHFIFAINDGEKEENKGLEFEEIDSIAANAFQDSSNIKQVFFDEHLQKIGKEAFKNCEDLEAFSCGKDLVFEEKNGNYIKKTEPEEPEEKAEETPNSQKQPDNTKNNVFVIESHAFEKCKNLHTVILPDCDELVIEKDAFSGCSSLRTLVCLMDEINFTGNPFEDCPENLTFVGKKGSALERFARENGYRYIDA